jgi:cyclopropane-fatty-acyl-phospholipid synthase
MTGTVRFLMRLLLRRIRSGTLVVIEPDALRRYGRGFPQAAVEVRSRRAWRQLLRGSLGLGESYAAGEWESPDLVSVMRVAARNVGGLDRLRARFSRLWGPLQYLRALRRPATRRRQRQDIAAHYDLGNGLFTRMLDATMTYSCALFSRPEMSLEEAQRSKLELICRKLSLGPGDRVLEIGTGWGGFALYAARTRRCQVTTTTISEEQYTYACQQVRRAGLDDLITVLREDYRDLGGQYDKLVSIEMIEAVGWRHTGRFLATCSGLLAAHGAMLLQTITIDDRLYEGEKAARSFITEHIFPGGSLPSLASLGRDLFRHTDLRMISLQELTPHYVRTLQEWRQRLAGHLEELSGLGYDERFQRIWMLYLAYCEAGFAERRIGDFQLLLGKPDCRLSGEPTQTMAAAATTRRQTARSDRAIVASPAG